MFVISKQKPTFSSCLIKMKLDAELGILIPNIHLYWWNMFPNEFLDYFTKCACKWSNKTWEPILLTFLFRKELQKETLKELQQEKGYYKNLSFSASRISTLFLVNDYVLRVKNNITKKTPTKQFKQTNKNQTKTKTPTTTLENLSTFYNKM